MRLGESVSTADGYTPQIGSGPTTTAKVTGGQAAGEGRLPYLMWPFVLHSLSGLLLAVAFPPFELGTVAWLALVPFATAVWYDCGSRWITYVAPFFGGLIYYLIAFEPVRCAYGTFSLTSSYSLMWLALGVFGGLQWFVTYIACRFLVQTFHWPLVAVLPIGWTALEYLRSPLGRAALQSPLDLLQLGESQSAMITLCQVVDLGGIPLLSFLIAAVNGWIADLLYALVAQGSYRRLPWLRLSGIALLSVMASAFVYGWCRLNSESSIASSGPLLALVSSRTFNSNTAEVLSRRLSRYAKQPDLIVLAEGAAGHILLPPQDNDPKFLDSWKQLGSNSQSKLGRVQAHDLVMWSRQVLNVPLLIGCKRAVVRPTGLTLFNSLVYTTPGGGIVDWYDKIVLMPFTEFSPFAQLLSGDAEVLSRGDDHASFLVESHGSDGRIDSWNVGVTVCYESSIASVHRDLWHSGAKRGRVPDFVINSASERFDHSLAIPQLLLNMAKLRAIEMRRSICRVVAGGYSAVIDGNGVVLSLKAPHGPADEPLVARVPIDARLSPYMLLGDWFPLLDCGGLFVIGCAAIIKRVAGYC